MVISTFKDEERFVVTKGKQIEQAYHNFYSRLYKAQEETFKQIKLKAHIHENILKKFTKSMNFKLAQCSWRSFTYL
jgi:hypothetical protein